MENLVAYTFHDVDEEFLVAQPITAIVRMSNNFIIYSITNGERRLFLESLRISRLRGINFYSLESGEEVKVETLKEEFQIKNFNEVIYFSNEVVEDRELEQFTKDLKNGKVVL